MSFRGRQFVPGGGPPYELGSSYSRNRETDRDPRASFRGRGRYVSAEFDRGYYPSDRTANLYHAEIERPDQDRSRSPSKHERYHGREYSECERLRDDERRAHYKAANSPPRNQSTRSRSPPGSDGNNSSRHVKHTESAGVREHRRGSRGTTERVHMEEVDVPPSIVQHDSKLAAVEKAKEMALRTRQIISKLGGLKQLTSVPDSLTPDFRDSEISESKHVPARTSPAKNVSGKAGLTDSKSAISKMLQNESLIKYAFTIPIGDDSNKSTDRRMQTSMSERSMDNRSSAFVGADSEPYETADDDEYKLFDYSHGMPSSAQPNKASWSETAVSHGSVQQPSSVNVAAPSDRSIGLSSRMETDATGCDPTIANILKSIGFNFDMSKLVQQKTQAATAVVDHKPTVQQTPVTVRSTNQTYLESVKAKYNSGVMQQSYEDMAQSYRAEKQKQLGLRAPEIEPVASAIVDSTLTARSSLQQLQTSYDASELTFKEDIFRDPSPEMKLRFKTTTKSNNRDGLLYEDFSDSDESFADTACSRPLFDDSYPADKGTSSASVNRSEQNSSSGPPKQAAAKTVAAEEHDWVQSTEEFIRKLQQPRPETADKQSSRHVTIVPKRDNSRAASTPRGDVNNEHQQVSSKDRVRLMETVLPLEELKNIKKTIVVSEVSSSAAAKNSDKSDKAVFDSSRDKNKANENTIASGTSGSESADRYKSLQNRQEPDRVKENDRAVGSNNSSTETVDKIKKNSNQSQPVLGSKSMSPAPVDSETLERHKKIDALVKELEGLRRQQSALWRRKKREKDGHKDPILIENSKLQEEISKQIVLLKQASKKASENVPQKTPVKKQIRKKDEDDRSSSESDHLPSKKDNSKFASSSKSRRSRSPNNTSWRSKSDIRTERQNSDRAEVKSKPMKPKRVNTRIEYFDGGNHFCRCCNHVSVNIFEYCQHLQTAAHKLAMDATYKPWVKAVPSVAPGKFKGNIQALRVRGVEFLMSTTAFYCSLCDEFYGSTALVEAHFKSEIHNGKYQKHLDDNPYYERRLNLDKSAMTVMAPKPQTGGNDLKISEHSVSGETTHNAKLMSVIEQAKARAKRLASLNVTGNTPDHQEEDILLPPPFKKSRVVPKSSSKKADDELAKLLSTADDASKLEDVEWDTDEVVDTTKTSLDKSSTNENSMKEDTPPNKVETASVPAKKSLPFIGKRPNMKNLRATKNSSTEKPSDSETKIPIKITTKESADFIMGSNENTLKPMEGEKPVIEQRDSTREAILEVLDMEVEDTDALGSFLTIGDAGSGQSHSVPVVKVNAIGPQTLSSYLLLHQSSQSAVFGTKANTIASQSSTNNSRSRDSQNHSVSEANNSNTQHAHIMNQSNVSAVKVQAAAGEVGVSLEASEHASFTLSVDEELAKLLLSKNDMSKLDEVEWEADDVEDGAKHYPTSKASAHETSVVLDISSAKDQTSEPSNDELAKLLQSKSDMSNLDDIEWEVDDSEEVAETSSSKISSADETKDLRCVLSAKDETAVISGRISAPLNEEIAALLSARDVSKLDDVEWETDDVEDAAINTSSTVSRIDEINVHEGTSSANNKAAAVSTQAPLTDEIAKLLLSKSDVSKLDDIEWETDDVEDVDNASIAKGSVDENNDTVKDALTSIGDTTKTTLPFTEEITALLLTQKDVSRLNDIEWETDDVEDVDNTSIAKGSVDENNDTVKNALSSIGDATKTTLPFTEEITALLLSQKDVSKLNDIEWETDDVEDLAKTSTSECIASNNSLGEDGSYNNIGASVVAAKTQLPFTQELAALFLANSDISNLNEVELETDHVKNVPNDSLGRWKADESNMCDETTTEAMAVSSTNPLPVTDKEPDIKTVQYVENVSSKKPTEINDESPIKIADCETEANIQSEGNVVGKSFVSDDSASSTSATEYGKSLELWSAADRMDSDNCSSVINEMETTDVSAQIENNLTTNEKNDLQVNEIEANRSTSATEFGKSLKLWSAADRMDSDNCSSVINEMVTADVNAQIETNSTTNEKNDLQEYKIVGNRSAVVDIYASSIAATDCEQISKINTAADGSASTSQFDPDYQGEKVIDISESLLKTVDIKNILPGFCNPTELSCVDSASLNQDSLNAEHNATGGSRNDLELSVTIDENLENETEDYESHDEKTLRLPRDEEVAILLPHIAEQFMQPAISVVDNDQNRMIVNTNESDSIDDCNTGNISGFT